MIARVVDRGRQARRGITIVETIVLMTVVAAMLGLCVLLLQMLMKLEAGERGRRDAAVTLGRLAAQFRDDLHAARSASPVEPRKDVAGGLLLEGTGGRTVEYRADEAGVLRVESQEGKPVRRERYELPRCGPIGLALDREEDRQFARLTLSRRNGMNPEEPARPFEVLALVGKNGGRTPGGTRP